jgi:hypothetical protein
MAMFDSWDDYALAVFNPAASSYNMITEGYAGIKEQEQLDKENKRDSAIADAEAEAEVAAIRASTRSLGGSGASSGASSSSSSSPSSGLNVSTRSLGSGRGDSDSSTSDSSTYVGAAVVASLIGGAVYYYWRNHKRGRK